MNFSTLEDLHTKWRDILVIGRTIEQDGRKYHIVGMTLSDEARLYIIEPYMESGHRDGEKARTYRQLLKEHERNDCSYLHCSDFYLGSTRLRLQSGSGGCLAFSSEDYGTIQIFLDMMSAGWLIPEWLKNADWDSLQLVTLTMAGPENQTMPDTEKSAMANPGKLPEYSPDTPITITHRPNPIRHILEKTITLTIGKSRSFYFMDDYGDKVQCHINSVYFIDIWEHTKEEFRDPKLAERFSPEQLEQAKKLSYEALEQNCPTGMGYIGIEYECSKDLNLIFYSKEYLKSRPGTHQGSSRYFLMRLKPDKETGTHGLPLKGCVITDTPFPPDASKIPAELFLYYEKAAEWTETIP